MLAETHVIDQLDLSLAQRLSIAQRGHMQDLLAAVDRFGPSRLADVEPERSDTENDQVLRIPGRILWFVHGEWRQVDAEQLATINLHKNGVLNHFPTEYMKLIDEWADESSNAQPLEGNEQK